MADMINFTLPTFNNSTTDGDIKQIKAYLYTLTEQMKFYLNNIDADNYNDEYREKMAELIDSNRTNSVKATVVQDTMHKIKKEYDNAIQNAVGRISGNLGGYIVTLDLNNDGYPDDFRILVDTYDYKTATKYWQFNRAGLAFIEKNAGELTSSVALTDDGYIAGNRVKGVLGSFVTLEACTLNACIGSFSGKIIATEGHIGGWDVNDEKIYQRRVYGDKTYEVVLKSDRTNSDNKKIIYCNMFTDGRNSDSPDGDYYKTEKFYIRRNGEVKLAAGEIAGWNIDDESFYADYENYRAYIQKPSSSKVWAFSTQTKQSDGSYKATYLVMPNGELQASRYKDIDGYDVISWNNTAHHYIFGYGAYSLGWDTYLEGGNILLRCKNGSGVKIQNNTATIFTMGQWGWKFDSESSYINRNTIESSGGFVLSANNGNNALYLVGASIRLRNDTYLPFKATSGTISLVVNSSGKITSTSSSERYKENFTETLDEERDPRRLYNLPVEQYNYKNEYKDIELVAGTQIGIRAENVAKYYPNACIYNDRGQPESWQDRILIPAMLKLIQELHEEIELLKVRS